MSSNGDRAAVLGLPALPQGWEWVPLKQLAAPEPRALTDGPFGSNLKTEHYTDSGPRVIRLQNIGEGEFLAADAHISEERFELLKDHEARAGDIVLASLGEPLPRACLVPDDLGPAIVKADCPRLRPHPDVNAKYLMWGLNSEVVRVQAATVIHGVGRPRLKLAELKKLLVPVPPPLEQALIVEAVEYYQSRVSDGLRYFAAAIEGAARMRQALLERCWTGHPTERLEDLLAAPLKNGRSVPTAEQGFPVLRLTALRGGVLDTREAKIGAWTEDLARPYLIEQDDFLVSRGNGSLRLVGRGGLVISEPPPVAFPDTLIRVRADDSRMGGRFLRLAWDSQRVRAQIEERAHTSAGIYKVNQDMLRDVELPVPPLDEQDRLALEIEGHMTALATLETYLQEQLSRAEALKRAVLQSAFLGRLGAHSSEASSQTSAVRS